jgi:8-oxo-dGTP pyrophosphatase MutT (NUDIX family)
VGDDPGGTDRVGAVGLSWEESYLGRMRALAGDQVILMVGARCVLRDEAGRVLLIRRSDNRHWALPAGALEIGESIGDCARREVLEETGLTATRLTPFAMYTGLTHTIVNAFGDTYQLHTSAFRVDAWTGSLIRETEETVDADFFDAARLPSPAVQAVRRTLSDLARFEETGGFVLS